MRHGIKCPYCGVFCLVSRGSTDQPAGWTEKEALDSHLQASYENVVGLPSGFGIMVQPISRPNPCYMKKNPLAFVDETLKPKPKPRRMIQI